MSGFDNEIKILNSLNNRYFNDLSDNFKKLILKLNKETPLDMIICHKKGGIVKSDINIIIDNNTFKMSIKKGTGNSVHQEKVEDFINYLKHNMINDEDVFNDIRHFIWGDNSLDGSGEIHDRLGVEDYKKLYPSKIQKIQDYFNEIKPDLIERFVISGKNPDQKIDCLYYGDDKNGKVVWAEDLFNYLLNTESKGAISVGRLSFQAWNRNINGGIKSEKKRGQIQLKWGTLKNDIEYL